MILTGRRFEFGTLEESLAVQAINRRAEIEFLKLQVVVNAIISVGNHVSAAVTGSDSAGGGDALKKSFDAVKEALLPHWAEESERRAVKVKKTLMEEVNRGPLKIKVVGKDKKTRRRN